jgi:hypothetical protein
MQDIKMNSSAAMPVPHIRPQRAWKRALRWVISLAIISIIIGSVWSFFAGAASWRAVFLTNNQVYFGHFYDVPLSGSITLHNVYYLQVSGANQDLSNGNQSQFKLVQLGNEIHGPTDEMVIPKGQVLFWETLRPDSAIVAAIKSLTH